MRVAKYTTRERGSGNSKNPLFTGFSREPRSRPRVEGCTVSGLYLLSLNAAAPWHFLYLLRQAGRMKLEPWRPRARRGSRNSLMASEARAALLAAPLDRRYPSNSSRFERTLVVRFLLCGGEPNEGGRKSSGIGAAVAYGNAIETGSGLPTDHASRPFQSIRSGAFCIIEST
jgi:hypothetical protein